MVVRKRNGVYFNNLYSGYNVNKMVICSIKEYRDRNKKYY